MFKFQINQPYCFLAVILISFSVFGCKTLDQNLAIGAGIDIIKSMSVNDREVLKMSRLSAQEMDKKNTLAGSNSAYTKRLNRLFVKHKHEDGLNLNYKVYMADHFNAFAMPDGTVRVYSGLMDALNDEELLAVIGHEIGHVKLQHSLQAYKRAYLSSGLRKGVAAIGGSVGSLVASQLGELGQQFALSRFSRSHELEADEYGMQLMKRHHYNPRAMISAFEKMQKIAGEGGGLLSSHPATSVRIQKMQQHL